MAFEAAGSRTRALCSTALRLSLLMWCIGAQSLQIDVSTLALGLQDDDNVYRICGAAQPGE